VRKKKRKKKKEKRSDVDALGRCASVVQVREM
jgi:hypothetical protein